MSRLLTLVLILVSVAFTSIQAQTTTNRTILQKAGTDAAIQEQKDYLRLKQLAAEKKWPLMSRGKNGAIARLVGIDPSGDPLYVTTYDNLAGAATVRTNLLWPGASTGINLNGSSANIKGKIAIWDGGAVNATHVELNGRVLQKDNPATTEDHSTHVAGIMINSGVNPIAKGMAYGAQQLLAYDFGNHISEMFSEAQNLLVSNHSYGTISGWYYNDGESRWEFRGEFGANEDYKFGYYDNEARNWDSIAYNAPNYLIVKAAGNNRDVNGPDINQKYFRYNANNTIIDAGNRPAGISDNDSFDILPTYSVAKNVLTVGAVNPITGGYTRPSDVVLSTFTSWGPTDDGRIKPDIVTDGVDLYSGMASSNNAYAYLSGTSMATPVATGSIFLLQEYFSKLNGGAFMRAATLKGLVIHTADEAGTAEGPDYKHGWGLLNMEKAASVITSANTDQLIQERTLNNGATYTQNVVASGKGMLVATISWTDPKGTVNTTNRLNNPERKLINDLDIRITSDGTTYMPYILDPVNRNNAATKGDNILDNVEKIVIPGAIPGQAYSITVSHKQTLERGSQAFSLLVSGVGGTAYCTSTATAAGNTRIDSLSIGSFRSSLSSACTGYGNLMTQIVSLQPGQNYPFAVRVGTCNGSSASRVIKLFLDYNNNGIFETGEKVAESAVLSGSVIYNGDFTTPANLKVGNNTRLRIVAVETANPNDVNACGNYAGGQTIDLLGSVVSPSKNVGVIAVVNPLNTSCATDSQMVTIRIKNFGDVPQSNIPVTAVIRNGGATLATFNAVYPLSIDGGAESNFTFQAYYNSTGASAITIAARTNLNGDQTPANDEYTATIAAGAAGAAPTGTAEQCGSEEVTLTRTGDVSSGTAFWYTAATGGTPIASGNATTTTVIPTDRTYYLGLNDAKTKGGLANKMIFPDGGYNAFTGYLRFSTTGPMIIESARLYIGHAGKIEVTVGEIASEENGQVARYYALSTNTIDVYPTTPTPKTGLVNTNNPNDTGAVFALNLQVPAAGNKYIIYLRCLDSATIFRNTSSG
ncbi:MAG: S8 family serine peptidase, partial [Flavitalea sp.]